MSHARSIAIAALFAFATCTAHAADAGKRSEIRAPYGITDVPLTQGGVQATLVRARRENFNAHSFDVLSIYVRAASGLELVPLWDDDEELHELETVEGADCKLKTFHFFSEPGKDLQLVIARRPLGESYADAADVTFIYFTLKRNTEAVPGWPRYYFERTRTTKAKRQYCDVDEALAQEAGLIRPSSG